MTRNMTRYLGDRKDRKLDELEADIADEEFIFGDELTAAERAELDKKKKLLALAKEHDTLDKKMKVDGYVL